MNQMNRVWVNIISIRIHEDIDTALEHALEKLTKHTQVSKPQTSRYSP